MNTGEFDYTHLGVKKLILNNAIGNCDDYARFINSLGPSLKSVELSLCTIRKTETHQGFEAIKHPISHLTLYSTAFCEELSMAELYMALLKSENIEMIKFSSNNIQLPGDAKLNCSPIMQINLSHLGHFSVNAEKVIRLTLDCDGNVSELNEKLSQILEFPRMINIRELHLILPHRSKLNQLSSYIANILSTINHLQTLEINSRGNEVGWLSDALNLLHSKNVNLSSVQRLIINDNIESSAKPSELIKYFTNVEYIIYKNFIACRPAQPYLVDLDDTLVIDEIPSHLSETQSKLLSKLLSNEEPPNDIDIADNDSEANQDKSKLTPFSTDSYGNCPRCKITKEGPILTNIMSQGIIINKLVRYLKLTNQLNDIILDKITLGICYTLSNLYCNIDDTHWVTFNSLIKRFTGNESEPIDSATKEQFELLLHYYYLYNNPYNNQNTSASFFIGGQIDSLLKQLENGSSLILKNLDHAITVRKVSDNALRLYDPNFKSGLPRETDFEDGISLITNYCLGKLIFTHQKSPIIDDKLFSHWKDWGEFIRDGGLCALTTDSNIDLITYFIKAFDIHAASRNDCITGLCIGGSEIVMPTLVSLLRVKAMDPVTLAILHKIIDSRADDEISETMLKLLSNLEHQQPHALMIILDALSDPSRPFAGTLPKSFFVSFHSIFDKMLAKSFDAEKLALNRSLTAQNGNNYDITYTKSEALIFSDTTELMTFSVSILKHYLIKATPVILISETHELDYKGSLLVRDTMDRGEPRDGLKELNLFIHRNNDDDKALIILDCENIEPSTIIAYRKLLNPDSKIKVLALISTANPNLPLLQDWVPLFRAIREPSSNESSFLNYFSSTLPNFHPTNSLNNDSIIIDLYHSSRWKSILLGQWRLEDDTIIFHEGSMPSAMTSGKPIMIANGPWDDPSFRLFWQHALLTGKVDNQGRAIKIPENLIINTIEGYEHLKINDHLIAEMGSSMDEDAFILYSSVLQSFLSTYELNPATGKLITKPGIIERHAGKTLQINYTHDLSDDELARIATCCKKHNVKLKLLTFDRETISKYIPVTHVDYKKQKPLGASIVFTNDPDAMSEKLVTKSYPSAIVINVTGRSSTQLLEHFILDQQSESKRFLSFKFKPCKGVIIESLESNSVVMLKGHFSADLAQGLSRFILDSKNHFKEKLIIITDSLSQFNYVEHEQYDFSLADKLALLSPHLSVAVDDERLADWKDRPYSELRAQLIYRKIFELSSISNDPWQGLKSININMPQSQFTQSSCQIEADAFNQERLSSVASVFEYSPYVFIAGITAVGKTQFVRKVLKNAFSANLYHEKDSISAWANDTNAHKLKILFLDEFNIGDNQGYEFEDLFNDPPCILDPKTHERIVLTDQHKVIFAGNPINYSSNRHMPALIQRHGCSIIFNPLTPAYIYSKILLPLFAKHPVLAEQSLTLCEPILSIYAYACQISRDEVLITPRELSMMVILSIASAERNPDCNIAEASAYYAYLLSESHIPREHIANFDSLFRKERPLNLTALPLPNDNFILSDSRVKQAEVINDLLMLRSLRREHDETWNKRLKFGGLGGLVLQGEESTGKLALLKAVVNGLLGSDSHEIILIKATTKASKAKRELLDAFNEGKVVIMEEVGRSPNLEKYLNAMLMGINPESNQSPNKPGFLLLGTHTLTHGLYEAHLSTAITRRVVSISVNPYTPQEKISLDKHLKSKLTTLKAFMSLYKSMHHVQTIGISEYLRESQTHLAMNMDSIEAVEKYAALNPASKIAETLKVLNERITHRAEQGSKI